MDSHDAAAFKLVSHLTVGGLRDWLLLDETDTARIEKHRKCFNARNGRRSIQANAQPGP
jgi:ethanolamine ammonia-lyase large subunit